MKEENGGNQKMKGKKYTKGITLISLAITVVILLILAGISIGTLVGNKGIVEKASSAKETAEKVSLEEKIEAAIITAEQKHKNATLEEVCDEIEKIENVTVNRTTGEITSSLGYTITGKLDKYLSK